mmetsp:Transcript_36709/g.98345  ORF Transcript_36709/g.98345 Transcript_36709/m.98345 type:complete len:223 (-) Transcript_36709:57-725(-)
MSPESQASPTSVHTIAAVLQSQPPKNWPNWNLESSVRLKTTVSIFPTPRCVMIDSNGMASFCLNAHSAKSVARALKTTQVKTHKRPTQGTEATAILLSSLRAVNEQHAMQMQMITCHCTRVYRLPSTMAERIAVMGSFIWPTSLMKAPSKCGKDLSRPKSEIAKDAETGNSFKMLPGSTESRTPRRPRRMNETTSPRPMEAAALMNSAVCSSWPLEAWSPTR